MEPSKPLVCNWLPAPVLRPVSRERPSHALPAIALVHEVYLRLMEVAEAARGRRIDLNSFVGLVHDGSRAGRGRPKLSFVKARPGHELATTAL